jgi:carotenoid cleavage dioxygenase-like enzyme
MLTGAADATIAKGWETLEDEVVLDDVAVEGELPTWLEGTLVRNGPAGFDQGQRHWFDGLAMLHRFAIADGRVSYANRFLRTKAFAAAQEGRVGYREFASDPCRSLFRRVTSLFAPGFTDNAVVNVVRSGEEFLALTETPMPVRFDPRTLETLGVVEPAPGETPTAHPHVDPTTGELVNAAVHFGPRSSYVVSARAPGASWRRIGAVPVREPGYLHSFAMTERHVVLVVGPLVVNPLKLALADRPFIENYRWMPERGTDVIALDRTTGGIAGRWTVDPLFTFHHVNAFEADGELVVDLCAYADARIVDELYVDRLRGDAAAELSAVRPQRLRLPLGGGAPRLEPLADVDLEMPRIDNTRNTLPYRVAWGLSGFDAIARLDVTTGEVARWHEDGCHPGEPVHVPAPDATDEDEGMLLSVVLDGNAGRSFLLVLDAATLDEVARARLPHHVPFGFHGHFYEV